MRNYDVNKRNAFDKVFNNILYWKKKLIFECPKSSCLNFFFLKNQILKSLKSALNINLCCIIKINSIFINLLFFYHIGKIIGED